MRYQFALSLFATVAAATPALLIDRSVPDAGGWSLSVGTGTCPAGSSTCFSDQTGNTITSNRLNECCPSGTTPRLDCGTYVNTGQPYACCPLNNPDCRGDVEKTTTSSVCANSGWALWFIPDGGYNAFCCLPGQYGYWYKALGQDAVGQCSSSSTLPAGATPGTQVNNGDGTVSSAGVQIVPILPANVTCDGYGICKSTLAPAPVCDVIHYGWSLQTNTSTCTAGSNLCNYSNVTACCPTGLTCGTVVGDSEVPVCCPPGNPDCRGDVEGLWPQVCADSSWSLWHVNENGNHFCCKPGEIGYNRIHDVYATGLCGTAVPRNSNTTTWMRSILDYVGDGSVAGSHLTFPCDTSPAPNATYPNLINSILNPPAGLNPGVVSIVTYTSTKTDVVTSCFPTQTPVATGNSPFIPGNAGNPSSPQVSVVSSGGSSGSGSSASGSSSSGTGSSGTGSSGSSSSGSGSSGSSSSGSSSSGSGSSNSGSSNSNPAPISNSSSNATPSTPQTLTQTLTQTLYSTSLSTTILPSSGTSSATTLTSTITSAYSVIIVTRTIISSSSSASLNGAVNSNGVVMPSVSGGTATVASNTNTPVAPTSTRSGIAVFTGAAKRGEVGGVMGVVVGVVFGAGVL